MPGFDLVLFLATLSKEALHFLWAPHSGRYIDSRRKNTLFCIYLVTFPVGPGSIVYTTNQFTVCMSSGMWTQLQCCQQETKQGFRLALKPCRGLWWWGRVFKVLQRQWITIKICEGHRYSSMYLNVYVIPQCCTRVCTAQKGKMITAAALYYHHGVNGRNVESPS